MDKYYTVVIFLAVFIMLIMDMLVRSNDILEPGQRRRVYIISSLVIICSVSEWLGVYLDGTDIRFRALHIAVKTVELAAAPAITVLCSGLMNKLHRHRAICAVLLIHTALEIVSAFTGFIFYVDGANVYGHGQFYMIYVLAYLAGVVLFVYSLLSSAVRNYGINRMLMLALPTFFLCGLVLQYASGDIRVTWLCASVDVLMTYVLYSELMQRVDPMTHLLNRRSYESRLASLRRSAVIFFFDIDNFKAINDTYGHAFGDEALSAVGGAIYSVFGKNGICYRVGGDEFSAVMDIPVGAADRYVSDFLREMQQRRSADGRLPVVSVGYGAFSPENGDVATAVSCADAMMYSYKRQRKAADADAQSQSAEAGE